MYTGEATSIESMSCVEKSDVQWQCYLYKIYIELCEEE